MTAVRPNWALLTFGAGLPNWRAAARRLGHQAEKSGWFANLIVLTDRDLKEMYPEFFQRHRRILRPSVRGFGYWIWKPFLIAETLNKFGNSLEGVVYLDAGFELNTETERAAIRFRKYQEDALDSHGVFAMHLPGHAESSWSRLKTMDRFLLSPTQRSSPQIQATPLVTNQRRSVELIREWYEVCSEDSYSLLRDPARDETNDPTFQDHRHDQSIFSCLMKREGLGTIPDETYFAPDWQVGGRSFPLWAARNRTRISIRTNRKRDEAVRIVEKSYSRAFWEVARVARRFLADRHP